MGCFVQGGRNGMGCFVRGGKNGMGCFVWGNKDHMGCFVRAGKSLQMVLSGVSKKSAGQNPLGQKPTRTKAHWDKSPLGQKPTYMHFTGIGLN